MKQSPIRVLVVDDTKYLTKLYAGIIESLGGYVAQVVTCSSEAIRVFGEALKSSQRFDVVIIDLTLEEEVSTNGLDVLRKLRAIDPSIPAIATSGYINREGECFRFDISEFDGILPKPIYSDVLSTVLKHVLLTHVA